MTPLWWSIILAVMGILGIILAGKKKSIGWAVGLAAQVLWFIFAIVTKQYGFMLSAFAYGFVYYGNWRKWHAEERSNDDEPA